MKRPTRKEWFIAFHVIMLTGSAIYLSLFTLWFGLAIANGSWTYVADRLAPIEFGMLTVFSLYLMSILTIKVLEL